MSVALNESVIAVTGDCGVEEAETLLNLIQSNPNAPVDVSDAKRVHTALWQVMLATGPAVVGETSDPFARQWLLPMLAGTKDRDRPT